MKRIFCILLCFLLCMASCNALAATIGEQNALASAKGYLSILNFSYNGIIEMLEYEGFSYSESKYAADNCGADWFDQAAGSAKNYISIMSFSKSGLIEMLEYEGYTKEEAKYGAAVAYGENPTKPNNNERKTSTDINNSSIKKNEIEEVQTKLDLDQTEPKEINMSGLAFDLSGFTYEELCSLQQQVLLALWASDEWQEVKIPAGLYQVGVDIPAGKWTVSLDKQWARIIIGSKINATGNEVDSSTRDYYSVQINTNVPSQVISFADGMYVEIYNASLIFTPPASPQFSFN